MKIENIFFLETVADTKWNNNFITEDHGKVYSYRALNFVTSDLNIYGYIKS